MNGITAQTRQPGAGALVQHREMSKAKATFLVSLSGLTAIIAAMELRGWHVYLALALVGAGLVFGFVRWSRPTDRSSAE